MKKIQTYIAMFILVAAGAFMLTPALSVGAVGIDDVCKDNSDSAVCQENSKPENSNPGSFVANLINTLLFIVGGVSVLMIIVGGILYVVSQGDSSAIARAKNTLLSAIIGLIVAFLAYAIVNWVLDLF